MSWIHIAYLLGLIFIATKIDDTMRRNAFRKAWVTFAIIPMWGFIAHLIRAGQIPDVEALQLIEIWDGAITSILFGISLIFCVGTLAPKSPPPGVAVPKFPPTNPLIRSKPAQQDASSNH